MRIRNPHDHASPLKYERGRSAVGHYGEHLHAALAVGALEDIDLEGAGERLRRGTIGELKEEIRRVGASRAPVNAFTDVREWRWVGFEP
jgi:hypothetical protein